MAAMLFLRSFFRFPFSTGPSRSALAALAMALLGALALPAHAQNEGAATPVAATAGTASPAANASAAPADPKLLEQAERATLANDERNQIQVTPPGGLYGARGSRLLAMLGDGHHDVTLEPHEWRRLAAWIDANAIFYGAYDPERQRMQLAGEPIGMPDIQ